MKSYLIINQQTPYYNNNAQESLERALALSAFEQKVSLLFVGDGIWQLLNHQAPKAILRKNFIDTFKALNLYDIKNIYVEENGLFKRDLQQNDLLINVALVKPKQINDLITTTDVVLTLG